MKKVVNKQAKKASKLAKAQNIKNKFINVKNAEGDPDTTAEIVIQNKINYEPKVSVIIPVYNVEEYLRECLDSVINQTLKEIEIICVDDGSTDSSLEILKEYAQKDNRITVMKQANQGSGSARNNGIKNAKGEFIAFIDSDDLYPSLKTLKTMYTKAIKNNVLICGGSLNQLKDGELVTDPSKFEKGYTFEKDGIVEYKDYQFDYGYWRFIYKKQFLVENQLYFPDYLRGQDPPFFIKAMSLAEKFYAVIEPTYVYRVSHKEINWTERKVLDTIKSLTDCLQQTRDNNLDKLHYSIAKRLCNSWFINAFRNITKDNITCFTHMLNALNFSSIFKYDKNFKLPYFYQLLPNISRVCIVIPIYNVEQYLRECLDSVINQTYKNLEIICINDGSTDNSLEILNEYARKDDRIKVISQKNGGLSVARNTGLDNCNSEFVYFIDSDDYIAQNTIEILYNKIIDDYSDVAIGGVQCFGDEGIVVSKQHWFDSYNKSGRFNVVADVRNDVISISCNKLYKMSIIKEYGIRFPEGLINEDEYWLWAYMIHCKTYSSVRDKLYFYRQHKNSIMGKKDNSAKILDIIDIHCKIYEEIAKYKNKEDFENILTAVFIAQVGRLHNIIPKEYIELYKEKIVHYYNSYNNSEKIKQFLNSFSPKVSVIIPVYNVEKYLHQCLDSVVNQTLKDIEIICVDDGSTDNSLNIINEYAKKDCRIKILTQNHKKQGMARNKGIEKSTGKYIFFCDSDDFIKEETLNNLYKKAEQEQAEICQYLLCVYDEKTQKIINLTSNFYNPIRKIGKAYNYKILPNLIFERVEPVLKLYRRDFLINNNIKFFENCYFEDTIVHIKCISLAKRICFEDQVYYYYRKNRVGQTTRISDNTDKFLDIFNYINESKRFFKNNNMWEEIKSNYYTFAIKRFVSYFAMCNNKTKIKFIKKIKQWCREIDLDDLKHTSPDKYQQLLLIINSGAGNSNIWAYLLFPYYLFAIPFKKAKLNNIKNKTNTFKKIVRFFYHKENKDFSVKTYLCGIRIRKKINELEFMESRFANLSAQLNNKVEQTAKSQNDTFNRNIKNIQTKVEQIAKTQDVALKENIKNLHTKIEQLAKTQKETSAYNFTQICEYLNQVKDCSEVGIQQICNYVNEVKSSSDASTKQIYQQIEDVEKTFDITSKQNKQMIENCLQMLNKQTEQLIKQSEISLNNKEQLLDGIKSITTKAEENKNQLSASLSTNNEQINNLQKVLKENKEQADKNTSSIINTIERDQVLYNSPFEVRTRTERGLCDIVSAPNFEERFRKLISNLPQRDVATIVDIVKRLQTIKGTNHKIDLYNTSEKSQMKELKSYYQSILKISDNLYCYQNYFLPINHFEASVFFYKHGIDRLSNLQKLKDKAILDVGAFIGDSALILSPLTNDKVYSFEATTENYNHMLKTIELNNLTNIVPIKTAIGSEQGTIELRCDSSCSSSSDIMVKNPKSIENCPVIRIDDYVKEHNLKVGLIKVDIEGAEQEFLKGAIQTIKEQKPTLLISIYHNVDDFLDIKPMIENWKLGYKFSIFKPVVGTVSGETLLICE